MLDLNKIMLIIEFMARPINTKGATRPLERHEVKRLLKIASLSRHSDRNVMIIKFMLYTASRISECIGVSVKDIWNGIEVLPSVQFTNTKNNKCRTIPLNSSFRSEIKDYILRNKLSLDEPLFPSQKRGFIKPSSGSLLVKNLLNDAGLNSVKGSHGLRKTSLCNLVNSNVSLSTVIAISGHKDYSNLKYYLSSSIEKTSEAIETLKF